MIFGRHDLIQDAPISRIDLLTCRNTLMYFNTETQARILDRFHYALTDRGFLFLGKAETLLTYNDTFVPVDLKRRIFAKVPRGNHLRDRLLGLARAGGEEAADAPGQPRPAPRGRLRVRPGGPARRRLQRPARPGQRAGPVALRDRARATSAGRSRTCRSPTGRPTSARASTGPTRSGRPVTLAEVEWSPEAGEVGYLDIHVVPLLDPGGTLLGASVTFIDATVSRRLQDELQTSHQRAGGRLRGAPVDQRGAGDHQRGAPVDHRGAGDDQRGTPVDQRGAGDHERGAPVDQRGDRDGQRGAAASGARS